MGKTNYALSKFWLSVEKKPKDFFKVLINKPYNDNIGFGFEDVYFEDGIINANLLKKTPTYYYSWDEGTNSKQKINIVFVKEIPIRMDFKDNILLACGTISDLNSLKESLRNLFWNNFTYDSLSMKPFDVLKLFKNSDSIESINEISILDFNFEGIMSGRFNVKNADVNKSLDYLLDSKKEIDKISIDIIFEENIIKLTFKNNGKFSLQGKEDSKVDFLNYFCTKIK